MKDILIKLSIVIAIFIFLLGGCALDSNSYVPVIMCFISLLYLSIIAYVNGYI